MVKNGRFGPFWPMSRTGHIGPVLAYNHCNPKTPQKKRVFLRAIVTIDLYVAACNRGNHVVVFSLGPGANC